MMTTPSTAPPPLPQRPTASRPARPATSSASVVPAPAPSAPDAFEDNHVDEEFEDDGVSEGGDAQIGESREPWKRANGQTYVPRYLGPYQDVMFMRYARDQQEHIILVGPPGTGKTAMVDAAFYPDAATVKDPDGVEHAHRGMYSIVCTTDTTEGDFLGGYVQDPDTGRFRWAPGPLMLALLDNVPIFVDEILLADPRVLSSSLYPAMDGSGSLRIAANPTLPPIPVPDRFFVVAAGNPHVPGANFSPALRSRFDHHIEVSTDWQLARKLGVPSWLVRVAKDLDAIRAEGDMTWSPQLRELLSFRNQARQYGTAYAVAALVGKAPEGDDREVLSQQLGLAPEAGMKAPKPLRLGGQKPGRL